MSEPETIELLQFCATNNTPEFNRNKAMEEATEFNEAVLKYETKHPDNPKRPPREEILKEYGDFLYRGHILLIQLFPELSSDDIVQNIMGHVKMKLNKLSDYKKEGKYTKGL